MPLATILGVCALLGLPPSGRVPTPAYAVAVRLPQLQDSSSPNQTQEQPSGEPPTSAAPQQSDSAQKPAPGSEPTSEKSSKQNSEPASSQTGSAEAPTAAAPAAQTQKPTSHAHHKPKKKTARSTRKKSSSTAEKSRPDQKPAAKADAPDTVVVSNGGTGDPKVQLSPELTKQQATNQRKNVDQLLASTEGNLKALSERRLNSDQQDMVRQIRMYVEQAKQAAASSDLQRAHNLALKASLLADELAKH